MEPEDKTNEDARTESSPRFQFSAKRCGYCGRGAEENALTCPECGTLFANPGSEAQREPPMAPAPQRHNKIRLVFAAWGLALAAMLPVGVFLFMNPLVILLIPAGLCFALLGVEPKTSGLISGWVFYGVTTAALMMAKRRPIFFAFYFLLIIALVINVVGCYKVVDSISSELH